MKVLVSEKTYPYYTKYFGNERFYKAEKSPKVITETFKQMAEHINNTGSILMFPTSYTGMNNNNEEVHFGNGFGHLLRISDNDIQICSISIVPESKIKFNPIKRRKNKVLVNIKLSQKSDWLPENFRELSNANINAHLLNVYSKLHN